MNNLHEIDVSVSITKTTKACVKHVLSDRIKEHMHTNIAFSIMMPVSEMIRKSQLGPLAHGGRSKVYRLADMHGLITDKALKIEQIREITSTQCLKKSRVWGGCF